MKNIFIGIPRISAFNLGVHQVQYIHLAALFIKFGYAVQFYDENTDDKPSKFSEKIIAANTDIAIIIFSKVDLMKARNAAILINELKLIKKSVDSIIGIGYIAEANKEYLTQVTNTIDCIVSQSSVFCIRGKNNFTKITKEIEIIQKYYNNFYSLDKTIIQSLNYNLPKGSIVSLLSSIGCGNKCSFCGYNLHTPRRLIRPIHKLIDEIFFFEKEYDINRIIISDNSFGKTEEETFDRLSQFIEYKINKKIDVLLTLNISLQALSKRVVDKLKLAGCANLLIGIESFNPNTQEIFNKNVNTNKLFDIVSACDANNIVCTLSYIMFHPWQTIRSLKEEIYLIEKIGRYRIPQFFSNSILIVIPNTKLFQNLYTLKLINQKNETETIFQFQHKEVEEVYDKLKEYYESNINATSYISHKLKELKVKEWNYLKKLVL